MKLISRIILATLFSCVFILNSIAGTFVPVIVSNNTGNLSGKGMLGVYIILNAIIILMYVVKIFVYIFTHKARKKRVYHGVTFFQFVIWEINDNHQSIIPPSVLTIPFLIINFIAIIYLAYFIGIDLL